MNKNLLTTIVRRTPLLELEENIFAKAENLQTGRSYKIRGATNALAALPEEVLMNGVATVSAGNLGQAVAFAASLLEIPCRVYVPDSAPEVKKNNIRRFGAELVSLPFAQIWQMVRGKTHDSSMHFIHPCFATELRQGYGTIAQEILAENPEIEAFVIPFGLGTLFLGMADVIKQINPTAEVFACENEITSPLALALTANAGPREFHRSSLVDAIGTPELIPEIFVQVSPMVKESILVSQEETIQALSRLFHCGLVAEGAAAVSYAAAKKLSEKLPGKKIACVLSGGNIDLEILKHCFPS